jgi:hypothetical protein
MEKERPTAYLFRKLDPNVGNVRQETDKGRDSPFESGTSDNAVKFEAMLRNQNRKIDRPARASVRRYISALLPLCKQSRVPT